MPAVIADAFGRQAGYCRELGSPFNARLCNLLRERLAPDSSFGRRIFAWPGQPVEDALALRACGALHALSRSGDSPCLAAVYPPAVSADRQIWPAVEAAIAAHDRLLAGWLDSPPQTNEVSRSTAILGGCLTIARTTGLPLEIYEIGSSAGLNLGFDRWRYELGGTAWGPADAPVRIDSRCEGTIPLDTPLRVLHREGCDRNPLDPREAADRARLLAYIWPGQTERCARITAALRVAAEAGWRVEKADAGDWVEARLAEPGRPGRARVLLHTIVWQYLTDPTRMRIQAAMQAAGRTASADRPLAWLRVEPDAEKGSAGVRLTTWPDGRTRLLGRADYHGRWHRWAEPETVGAEIGGR